VEPGCLARRSEEVTSHCWETVSGESFQVRSKGYKTTKIKESSENSIYETVKVDAYTSPKKVPHFAQHVALSDDGDIEGVPINLVINVMLPRYAPNLVWAASGDGESWCIVLYCRLTEEAQVAIRKKKDNEALKLWQKFIEAEKDSALKKRLKCIVRCMNADQVGFNTASKALVSKYNGKPFLIRTTSSFYKAANYFEVDIDAHNFGKTARIGLYSCSEVAKAVVFDMCMLIEGDAEDELPEQILAGLQLDRLDPTLMSTIPFELPAPGSPYLTAKNGTPDPAPASPGTPGAGSEPEVGEEDGEPSD